MANHVPTILTVIVILFSAYSVLKFAVFFIVPYAKRRAGVDKSYAGRAYGTAKADMVLFAITLIFAATLLVTGAEPIAFLGGVFVGATLIQLFFHAFHVDPTKDRQAPEPLSPLKRLSYAIQDQPGRAAPVMVSYSIIVVAGLALYFLR